MSGILQTLFLGAAGALKDAYFNLTTLLLNTSSTNGAQNNTFLDSSTNNFSITRNGNTTQGTFTPFSQTGWGNYFGGASNYLSIADNAAFDFGTGNFCVEFWFNAPNQTTSYPAIISSSAYTGALSIRYDNTGYDNKIFVYMGGGGDPVLASTNAIANNVWAHVAVVRDSTTSLKIYVNGVLDGTATISSSLATDLSNGPMYVGRGFDVDGTNAYFTGYVSNIRVTKGGAVYTSAFTPSTIPLTTTVPSGTVSLLSCQSNRFIDNSSNAFAITVNGTPSVQAFSPFAPTIEYSTSVVGGSGYFDGTGDYLTVGSGTDVDLGTSDFMIEAWYYCVANGTYCSGVISKRVGGVASGWGMNSVGFVCDMNGTWYDSWANPFWVGSTSATGYNSSTSLQKLNQWTHIVVTRQGTDARWFVNGQLLGYFSRTGAIQQLTGSPLAVGLGGTTAEQPFNGYLSNCRVVVGSVPTGYQTSSTTLNTQIFTPPTAPVTTTSQGATSANVKYIGNFTNAGIFDAAAKNDLETVGNAQVSTTQAKWGTTAMYFDGTGDRLQVGQTTTPNLILGTGDFTIELWVRFISLPAGDLLLVGGDTNAAFLIANNSGQIRFGTYNVNWLIGPGGSMTTNNWYHVAVTRSGTTINLFLDGSAVVSSVSSAQNFSAASYVIGGDQVGGVTSLNGYMDDLRITKGYARYTANFTPPAAAFPLQ
jgi:hypothetical protein